MKISIEEKKKEAVKRMRAWGIFKPTIRQFEKQDLISESVPPMGACFWVEGEQLDRIKAFEEEHDAVVYHVIHSYTDIGEMEAYLYVSDEEEEWEFDREDIQHGIQFAYVYNDTYPELSEFGSIGVRLTPAAGLRRVA